jgi:hypothetical protein
MPLRAPLILALVGQPDGQAPAPLTALVAAVGLRPRWLAAVGVGRLATMGLRPAIWTVLPSPRESPPRLGQLRVHQGCAGTNPRLLDPGGACRPCSRGPKMLLPLARWQGQTPEQRQLGGFREALGPAKRTRVAPLGSLLSARAAASCWLQSRCCRPLRLLRGEGAAGAGASPATGSLPIAKAAQPSGQSCPPRPPLLPPPRLPLPTLLQRCLAPAPSRLPPLLASLLPPLRWLPPRLPVCQSRRVLRSLPKHPQVHTLTFLTRKQPQALASCPPTVQRLPCPSLPCCTRAAAARRLQEPLQKPQRRVQVPWALRLHAPRSGRAMRETMRQTRPRGLLAALQTVLPVTALQLTGRLAALPLAATGGRLRRRQRGCRAYRLVSFSRPGRGCLQLPPRPQQAPLFRQRVAARGTRQRALLAPTTAPGPPTGGP